MSHSAIQENKNATLSESSTSVYPKTTSSALLQSTNNLTVQSTPVASLTPNSALIRVRAVGICGSDVHYLTHGRIGDFIVKEPMILGHELSGEVVALGSAVSPNLKLKVGDRVAVEPGIGCGECDVCKGGRYNLCAGMRFLATPPVHGGLTTYFTHPAHLCHRLPANVSYEEGALCEPLSVAIYAARRAGLQLGQAVLIAGAGPIGVLTAMVALANGARRVIIMDVMEARLEKAKDILRTKGTSEEKSEEKDEDDVVQTVHIESGDTTSSILTKIRSCNSDSLVDIAFECSGVESSCVTCLRSTRVGGVLLLIGMSSTSSTLTLPIATEVLVREVDVRGIFRYVNTYSTAIGMIQMGKLDVKRLVTHRIDLRADKGKGKEKENNNKKGEENSDLLNQDGLLKGFETARIGKGEDGIDAIKVMFSL